jgi:phosphatidylserine/phosphatidylglycerophosphate/cardiolipin synthase-like enzyme
MNKKYGFKLLITAIAVSSLLLSCGSNKTTNTKAQAATESTQAQGNNLETYFTRKDGNLDKTLIKEMNTAQKNLNVAIYSLTKEDIANAIIDAKKRGVDVKVITDKKESQSKSEKAILDKLKSDGIPIKINSHSGLMHLKLSIIDDKTACGGSYNYTSNATKENDENLIVMRDPNIVSDYVNEFNSMWNNTSDYTNY